MSLPIKYLATLKKHHSGKIKHVKVPNDLSRIFSVGLSFKCYDLSKNKDYVKNFNVKFIHFLPNQTKYMLSVDESNVLQMIDVMTMEKQ